MSKPPPDIPKRGDRVRLRGKGNIGVLRKMNDASKWATVEWDDFGPRIVHLFELEKVDMHAGKV